MRSVRHWNLIAAVVVVAILGGVVCSTSTPGPSESSARNKIQKELDKWVAGDKDSKAAVFLWRIRSLEPPLSYKIRNVIPAKPKLSTDTLLKLTKENREVSENAPAFCIVVDVDFKSEAGTVLTKVEKYTLTWVTALSDWDIHEEM